MALVAIGYFIVWIAFSALGFWKFRNPRRQKIVSGSVIILAAAGIVFFTTAGTVDIWHDVRFGLTYFGIGATGALLRISHARNHLLSERRRN
jgi:O-antigen ligase